MFHNGGSVKVQCKCRPGRLDDLRVDRGRLCLSTQANVRGGRCGFVVNREMLRMLLTMAAAAPVVSARLPAPCRRGGGGGRLLGYDAMPPPPQLLVESPPPPPQLLVESPPPPPPPAPMA